MAERNYAEELPVKPPDGVIPWLRGQGYLQAEYLLYKMDTYHDPLTGCNVRAVRLVCTACKSVVFTEKAVPDIVAHASAPFGFVHPKTKEFCLSEDTCLCPECGTEATAIHTGLMPRGLKVNSCQPVSITRIDNRLVLLCWEIHKHIEKTGETSIFTHGYEAYVVEEKRIVRLSAHCRYIGSYSWQDWEQRKRFTDNWGLVDFVYPWDPKLLTGSTAENSALDILLRDTKEYGTYPITYLRHWQKNPRLENLVVQGGALLLSAIMDKVFTNHSYKTDAKPLCGLVNGKEKAPAKMLGMNRVEFRRCIREKWGVETLRFWQEEKEGGHRLTDDELPLARSIGFDECRWWKSKGLDWRKGARYIGKQKAKNERVDMLLYRDYWRIAEMIGEDLSLPAVQWPPRLMGAHDRVEQVRQWREKAKKKAEREARARLFAELFAELSRLSWEHDGICIRPIRDEEELIQEGKELHHCVGSYTETHIKGEQPIFVIRRVCEPDKPWFTLQLNVKKHTVIQNRGLRNCKRTQEVTAFELSWLAYLRESRKARDMDTSKESRLQPEPMISAI